jgi:hypothetical protein
MFINNRNTKRNRVKNWRRRFEDREICRSVHRDNDRLQTIHYHTISGINILRPFYQFTFSIIGSPGISHTLQGHFENQSPWVSLEWKRSIESEHEYRTVPIVSAAICVAEDDRYVTFSFVCVSQHGRWSSVLLICNFLKTTVGTSFPIKEYVCWYVRIHTLKDANGLVGIGGQRAFRADPHFLE